MGTGDPSPSRLARAGRAAFPGFHLRTLARTASTQNVVRTAARAGAAAGYCCTADVQTAGRGRQGRQWIAPSGSSLLVSILVRVPPAAGGGVALATGLAVRCAIAGATAAEITVKWPNDVLAGRRKLAGVLCEVVPGGGDELAVVVGFGVNLTAAAAPPDAAATSLEEVGGRAPAAADLLAAVLPELSARLDRLARDGIRAITAEWTEHAAGLGGPVSAHAAGGTISGIAEGIDDDGALLIRTASGLRRVLAGDVHLGSS